MNQRNIFPRQLERGKYKKNNRLGRDFISTFQDDFFQTLLTAAMINIIQPTINSTPPIGVIAPNTPI